jgi:tetratricopeptide (TPR) repeat protein
MNTILAIREPMAKMALTNDNSHIRVDSPSDIIFLDPNHPILSDVTWSNGVKQSRITKTTASGWKDIGDSHFKKRQFFASAAAYTYALRKDSTFTAARLNRCLTQLRLSNFVASLHDANRVIRTENLPEPDQIKALYRLAQAQYGAGEYPAAQNYYTRCLSIKPDQKEATEGIDKCQARIREQEEGTYDWIQLLTQTKTPGTRPDVADYMGPIAVTQMENRGGGRGVTATSDIKVGDLLVCPGRGLTCSSLISSSLFLKHSQWHLLRRRKRNPL